MDIKEYLENYSKSAGKFLEEYFNEQRKLAKRIDETVVGEGIENLFDYTKGGKKLRGALTVLGYQIAGGQDFNKILSVSCGIELFHNFLVIHDDIIDKDDERRGKPTIHKIYEKKYGEHFGISNAILVGDMGAFLGYRLIVNSGFTQEKMSKAFEHLNKYLLWTAYGQMLDVSYDYKEEVSWEEIEKVREYKTANYTIVMPLVVGATLNETDNRFELFEEYGIPIGIAFQLADDILGVFGDSEVTGKSNDSDIRDGKKTFLFAKALELASKSDKEYLLKWYGSDELDDKRVEKIRSIIKESGSLDFSKNLAEEKKEEGKKVIPKITDDLEFVEVLSSLADFVVQRKK